ncbi:MAG: ribonuclease HI [Epulopiscium sp.]|jgi:ribonuclease HI|nr:ribonuclease HI [Candidatus Epulonipiscium sp.]
MEIFEIYTDGACSNNQSEGLQAGGWAAVFVNGKAISGGDRATTNNRMEMKAVIEALKNTPPGSYVKIYSDSAYIINCFNQKWIDKWEKNGWLTSNKKPVENKDYWVEIRQLEKERKVEWIKVKGHSGNPWNEKADKLAVASIPMVDKKNDNDEVSRKTKIYLSEDEKKDLINFLEENKSFISKSLNDLLLRLKE